MLKQFKTEIILGLFGLFLVGAGIFLIKTRSDGGERVEIVTSEENVEVKSKSKIFVDISGAVERPGVIEVDLGTRIGEIISLAGGFDEDVNKEWVEMNLNMAVKAVDGQKIYIPKKGAGEVSNQSRVVLGVSINSATMEALEGLDGVGAVTAKKIIENRPYSSVDELVSKKVLTQSLYEKIKNHVTLW